MNHEPGPSMDLRTETLPGDPHCVVHHRYAVVNGVRLHYVEAVPQAETAKGNAKLCLLLHGFPEFWYSWRRQIPALAGRLSRRHRGPARLQRIG
jgi:hypothetical protein